MRMTRDLEGKIGVLFLCTIPSPGVSPFELSSFFLRHHKLPHPKKNSCSKDEKLKRLTFLNTVLFRPLVIWIFLLGPHALGALFEMVLQRRALSGVLTFCLM